MSLACSSASTDVTRIRSESCFQWGIKGMSPRVCIFICDRVGHIADYCHLGAHNAVGLARPPVGIASAVLSAFLSCYVDLHRWWCPLACLQVQSIWPDIWLMLILFLVKQLFFPIFAFGCWYRSFPLHSPFYGMLRVCCIFTYLLHGIGYESPCECAVWTQIKLLFHCLKYQLNAHIQRELKIQEVVKICRVQHCSKCAVEILIGMQHISDTLVQSQPKNNTKAPANEICAVVW